MKRRINALLALLFIITTLTTSLHELLPHHNSSDCQICTLVQHDNALVPEVQGELSRLTTLFETILLPKSDISCSPISTLNARAPPLFS
ncbi:hypothetical protein KKE54_05560 [bacterium]|nr:hypothetical protein [bacterium]